MVLAMILAINKMKADSIIYSKNAIKLLGNVKLCTEDTMTINCPEAVIKGDTIIFAKGFFVQKGKTKCKSKFAKCSGNITELNDFEIVSENIKIKAKYGIYYRKENAFKFTENIYYQDTLNRIRIEGDTGFYSLKTKSGWIKNGTFFSEIDSAYLSSNILKIKGDTLAIGTGNCIFKQGSYVCKSETVFYFQKKGISIFSPQSVFYGKGDSLCGRKLTVWLKDGKIQKVEIKGPVEGVKWITSK